MYRFLLQDKSSFESRVAISRSFVHDHEIVYASERYLKEIPKRHQEQLAQGCLTPIGSVEFIEILMREASVNAPCPMSYPDRLCWALNRVIQLTPKKDVDLSTSLFIKPYKTKLFSGFTTNDTTSYGQQERHAFDLLDEHELIWVSPIVDIESEWRYYICGEDIVGFARYDPYDNNSAPPDSNFVRSCIESFNDSDFSPCSYSIDIAVMRSSKNLINKEQREIVVEVNDAWALGLYRDMGDYDAYLTMLTNRWKEIVSHPMMPIATPAYTHI